MSFYFENETTEAKKPLKTSADITSPNDQGCGLLDSASQYWQDREALCLPQIEKELCAALLRADDTTVESLRVAAHDLKPEDFYLPHFRNIANLAIYLLKNGDIPSFSALGALAQQRNVDIGGIHALTELASDPSVRYCTAQMFEQSVKRLSQMAIKRTLRDQLLDQLKSLGSQDLGSALGQMRDLVTSLTHQAQKGTHAPTHIWDAIEPVLDRMVNPDQNNNWIVSTGFDELDGMLGGGLREADYVVLGARPSMGKTAMALNLARNISGGRAGDDTTKTTPILFFSLEMVNSALATRTLASESRVSMQHLRSGPIADDHLHQVINVVHRFRKSDLPSAVASDGPGSKFWLIDDAGLTLEDICTVARKFVREHGKTVFIIDYLQLIQLGASGRHLDKHTAISHISATLKSLAKELKCPIIALSQLNRTLEQRANKRPMLSDLRESGNIEQDADLIFFLYRDSVYHPDTSEPDSAEFIVAKQRDGAIGVLPMRYRGDIMQFEMQPAYPY